MFRPFFVTRGVRRGLVGGRGYYGIQTKSNVTQSFAALCPHTAAFYSVLHRFTAFHSALQRLAALYQEDMDCVCVRGDAMSMSE